MSRNLKQRGTLLRRSRVCVPLVADVWVGPTGVGVDLSSWARGVSTYADVTRGTGAINATSRAGLREATEYDIGAVWTYKSKGSFFDGLRSRIRYAWVTDNIPSGDQRSSDLRIDINLPISLL